MENVDKGDKLLDLFPDLMYALLLQLGSSQGPEAVSPVLKTWRLVHTGTLPEEINPQRCSGGQAVRGARQRARAGRGLRDSLRRQWTPRVTSTEGPSPSPPGGEKCLEAVLAPPLPPTRPARPVFRVCRPIGSCDRPLAP